MTSTALVRREPTLPQFLHPSLVGRRWDALVWDDTVDLDTRLRERGYPDDWEERLREKVVAAAWQEAFMRGFNDPYGP